MFGQGSPISDSRTISRYTARQFCFAMLACVVLSTGALVGNAKGVQFTQSSVQQQDAAQQSIVQDQQPLLPKPTQEEPPSVLLTPVINSGQLAPAPAESNPALTTGAPTPVVPSNQEVAVQPDNSSSPLNSRFRISWGGGASKVWQGTIELERGTFSNLASLGLAFDTPGAIRLSPQRIDIAHLLPNTYSGLDVSVACEKDSRLRITLFPDNNVEQKYEQVVSVEEVLSSPFAATLDSQQNNLSVARAPGDFIQTRISRDNLVLKPGETLNLGLAANYSGLESRSAKCRVAIVPARKQSPVLWSNTKEHALDEFGSSRFVDYQIPAPTEEGVYDMQIRMEHQAFGVKRRVVERTIQFVVLSESSPNQNARKQSWNVHWSFDPTRAANDGLLDWSPLMRAGTVLGNDQNSIVNLGRSRMVRLNPAGWQAIPLKVSRLGEPHVLEIEYLADEAMSLGLSILQPDSRGQIPAYGVDSGVIVPKAITRTRSADDPRKFATHRLTFWPSHKTPYLLVANRSENQNATFGEIRVLAGKRKLDSRQVGSSGNRRMMAFYEKPLFVKNFGVVESLDRELGQGLDDWVSFYQGADRMIQYLKANGYGGAFISVLSDGSSLYPSRLLNPTPRHDSGVFFSSGQDPIRKDVLEMLFRMFEREGLRLVPSLEFSSPLVEVETSRAADGTLNDFELVDFREVRSTILAGNNLPIYNPLDLTVQRSMQNVVSELSSRYKKFSSFQGVAVICRPDTYSLLPGRQWGYDRTTIQRFLQRTNSAPVADDEWPTVRASLLEEKQAQWIAWRADQMEQFYRQLQETIQESIPTARLYLAPVDLFRNEEVSLALAPSLHTSANFSQIMLHMGLRPQLTAPDRKNGSPGVVLLKPTRLAENGTLASRRVEANLESGQQLDSFFARCADYSDLFTHRVPWAHFAQLQQLSPFQIQNSPLMRLQPMTPSKEFNRKRFVESLRARDTQMIVDGGWLLPIGQEQAMQELVSVFSRLPAQEFIDVRPEDDSNQQTGNFLMTDPQAGQPFRNATAMRTVPENSRPVVVRQFRDESGWYFYAVNSSPWPVELNMTLATTFDASRVQSFSKMRLPIQQVEGQKQIVVPMEPYSMIGGTAQLKGSVGIEKINFKLIEGADEPLRKHLYVLQAKLIKSTKATPIRLIGNPNFHSAGQPSLEFWDRGNQASELVTLMPDQGYQPADTSEQPNQPKITPDETACLRLSSKKETVWVRSNEFVVPKTGRLSISVWLKTDNPEQNPPLRLAVEGRTQNSNYYRFGSIGSLAPNVEANQVAKQWKRFAVHFDDLPVEGLSNFRIGFDLMGPGQVCIDNIELFDRWFDENDSKAMNQILAGAGPLLEKTETLDRCRRMMEGYWPVFLDTHFDDGQSSSVERTARAANASYNGQTPQTPVQAVEQAMEQVYEEGFEPQVEPLYPVEQNRRGSMLRRFRQWGPPRGRNR